MMMKKVAGFSLIILLSIFSVFLSLTLMAFSGTIIGTGEGDTGYIPKDYVSPGSLWFGGKLEEEGSKEDYYDDNDATAFKIKFTNIRHDSAPDLETIVAAFNNDTGDWEYFEPRTFLPFTTGDVSYTIDVRARYSEVQLRANVYGDLYFDGASGTGFRHAVYINDPSKTQIRQIAITFKWNHFSSGWPTTYDNWETWTKEIRLFGTAVYRWYGVISTDITGRQRNVFDITETAYIAGHGYSQGTHDLYVVDDTHWIDGMDIPNRVSGTETSVTADAFGQIPAGTVAWNRPLTPGKYDIVIDVNGNRRYDESIDALDDDDIEVTAGFFVIPELPLGTVTALLSALAALTLFKKRLTIRIKP